MSSFRSHSVWEAFPLHKVSSSKPKQFLFFPLSAPPVYHCIRNKKIRRAKHTVKWSATSISTPPPYNILLSVIKCNIFSITQETLLLKARITITKLLQYFTSLMLQNSREIREPLLLSCKLLQFESTTVQNTPATSFSLPKPVLFTSLLHST